MRVIQINTTVNVGSTGRIAEDMGKWLLARGHESYIAFGNRMQPSVSSLIRVGNRWDRYAHGVKSLLADRHGFGSGRATRGLIASIQAVKPDLVHLHNLHGYYLQVEVLFGFLKQARLPVVWTFHDCWPFTGHCSYFDRYSCTRWQKQCYDCPNIQGYPMSVLIDHSTSNFKRKQKAFTGVPQLVMVAPSVWLGNHLQKSFLQSYSVEIIHNGIDLELFKRADGETVARKYGINGKKMVLGVAGQWDRRKGLSDFMALRALLHPEVAIMLVGLSRNQITSLPAGIIGIGRTESVSELAKLYSLAAVFVNPTYIDNFPTTNLEALACGTPVVTYQTGGSPEALDPDWQCVVPQGDVKSLARRITQLLEQGSPDSFTCRRRAEQLFDKNDRMADYFQLYERLLSHPFTS